MYLDERLRKDLSPDIYCLVHNKIVSLEQRCKKQKEVIDKIKNIFNNGTFEDGCDCILIEKLLEDKEVSE